MDLMLYRSRRRLMPLPLRAMESYFGRFTVRRLRALRAR